MLTGIYAARNLAIGADYDIWSVNVEAEYHEEGTSPALGGGDRMIPGRIAAAPEEQLAAQVLEEGLARLDPLALGVAVGVVCGLGLFAATAVLLFEGGPVVGPRLALLGNYLIGYSVSWSGAVVGAIEAAILGFLGAAAFAGLRNRALEAHARHLRRRAEAAARRDLLDKV